MPYIDPERKKDLAPFLNYMIVGMRSLENGPGYGDLNYVMTKLALAMKAERYDDMNSVHGTFFSAAAEYYRRKVAPYENKKAAVNGDVYEEGFE